MMVSVAFDSPHRNSIVPCGHRPVESVPLLDRVVPPSRAPRENQPQQTISAARQNQKKHTGRGRHSHSLNWTANRRITKMYCTEAHMKRKATTELNPTRTNFEMVSSQRVGLPMHTRSGGVTFVAPTGGSGTGTTGLLDDALGDVHKSFQKKRKPEQRPRLNR